ncbi:hypothetical protein B0H14DRAFT_3871178 [Mycena olivaceomarginata]|nr:hypothetical protein B0H14DRAFT_3871178 [Mycena olivaceomarginata]
MALYNPCDYAHRHSPFPLPRGRLHPQDGSASTAKTKIATVFLATTRSMEALALGVTPTVTTTRQTPAASPPPPSLTPSLAGRPQPQHAQLYATGVLRVACVGLRCVGFNQGVYRGVLEQAAAAWVAHSSGKGGLGMGGGAWNATVNGNGAAGEGVGGVAGGIAGMTIGGGGGTQAGGGNGKGENPTRCTTPTTSMPKCPHLP